MCKFDMGPPPSGPSGNNQWSTDAPTNSSWIMEPADQKKKNDVMGSSKNRGQSRALFFSTNKYDVLFNFAFRWEADCDPTCLKISDHDFGGTWSAGIGANRRQITSRTKFPQWDKIMVG